MQEIADIMVDFTARSRLIPPRCDARLRPILQTSPPRAPPCGKLDQQQGCCWSSTPAAHEALDPLRVLWMVGAHGPSPLGLPNCSLNRRIFCGGAWPPRAIEISQGDREIGSRASPEFGFRAAACESNALCSPRRKYFLFRSSEPKNAFSPSQNSRTPELPVNSRSHEVA